MEITVREVGVYWRMRGRRRRELHDPLGATDLVEAPHDPTVPTLPQRARRGWGTRQPEIPHGSQNPRPVAESATRVGHPGGEFESEDFELAKREELMRRFQQHRELMERLTRH